MNLRRKIKYKSLTIIKVIFFIIAIFLLLQCFKPTWTPKIKGENSISELRKVHINGTELEVMIRGYNKENPIAIFVHGGPCCSEIPYVRKYQDLLEKNFTIVHYDQRGSGKSYNIGTDYSNVCANTHVEDLIELTKYIEEYLGQEKSILIGHSYGTYIATMASNQQPELYQAYIGIGQVSDMVQSELYGLNKCIDAAKIAKDTDDLKYLESIENDIKQGGSITPRQYVRKYGFSAKNIDENADYLQGFLLGTEYNFIDTIGFCVATSKYQHELITETMNCPITDIVKNIDIPVYFVMGKYDCMTSPEAADKYLNSLSGKSTKQMVIFKDSAHYPQFEEKEKFYEFMCNTFLK
ncbi:alpha/beta hydrolase [Clostridium botulinum]|uniref:Alpha/beta hydrolase n=1 Tax=Clostridium botulinum TaxID=1491 RepID=A0A0M1M154_CLOBO|nr:alpha/beta hydrolase [Clostridium botulinum]KAI3345047.1 alpha/beta hydrolase [Clostridium botulinum]KOM87703.1 alpha/beta hydrolase [Clostridium botulinum]KOR63631.1 alpha/beta hydrolase [Clostridium botulinum]MCS6112268.1 alpha/beta hydrolase [Clostridium botulinum]NFE13281.1 alpha/beta hydrolase [Clostridium botulinum]